MNIYQFLSGLGKCYKERLQVCKIISLLKKRGRFILTLLSIAFVSGNIYAQHLFSVEYNDLSQENVRQVKEQVINSGVSITTLASSLKGECDISLSTVQNTKIIILNEKTGNNVVVTPTKDAPTQFRLQPFFIEELSRSALGDTDRYLIIEAGADFSVRSAASVSRTTEDVFIPAYFYGNNENVKEALPADRQIIHIIKEKPRLIPAFPDDPENLRYVAQLEEEMSYYVYMYKLPGGTLCIYDEHFNPSEGKNGVSTSTKTNTRASTRTCCTHLQFILSGSLNIQQRTATEYALELWSEQLAGTVPIDINVTFLNMNNPNILGGSYTQPNFLDDGTYFPQYPNTWYSSAQWNQIVGYDATTQRDIRIEMNTQFGFYFGLDGNTSGFDYITIILHEVTHGLGFFPLCGSNGAYLYGNNPGIFDRQLYQGTIGNICLTDLTQTQRAALVTSRNLYAGRPGSYLLAANSGNRVKMYAPSPWQSGSSVSHWDLGQTFQNFMQYAYQYPLHTFNTRKIAILRDMGWEIPCPSTVNFFNQTVTTNTTVTSCGDINLQNVTVTNGAKLILDAVGEVNIISNFEVALGSEFEIR